MNSQDDSDAQQGAMRSQLNAGGQQAGPAQQMAGGGAAQQGGDTGRANLQQGSQQQAYSPAAAQQGRTPVRRGGMPSQFGGRMSPFEMMRRLDEDFDRVLQQLWGGGRGAMRARGGGAPIMWVPQVDVREEAGKLHVFADLPGLTKNDVTLRIEGDQVVLQGERQSSREDGQQGSGVYHSERSYGSFCRTIPLPEGVDPQTATATFQDGVLDVSFDAPRRPDQQTRHIEIR